MGLGLVRTIYEWVLLLLIIFLPGCALTWGPCESEAATRCKEGGGRIVFPIPPPAP